MNEEEFARTLSDIGISISKEQLELLDKFYSILVEWNEKINLTGITDKKEVYLKHFYDSLTLYKAYDLTKDINMCDVGSGAGFPGIVLKIVFPNLNIVLVDSLGKRVNYLNEVIRELGLVNIVAKHVRMEEFSRDNKNKFDVITARAVASIPVLAEISFLSLRLGGKLILMKANAEEELKSSIGAITKLGLKLDNTFIFSLPIENSKRMLISIEKVKQINTDVFPRSIDKIRKKPL